MKRSTKNICIRLWEDDIRFILSEFKCINKGVNFLIKSGRVLQSESLLELEGFFTREEWIFLAYILKPSDERKTDPASSCSKNELCRMILDAQNLVAYASYCNVNTGDMVRRIRKQLNAVHILAIWMRVWNFWGHNEGVDIHEWADF